MDGESQVLANGTVEDGEPDVEKVFAEQRAVSEHHLEPGYWLEVKVMSCTKLGKRFRYESDHWFKTDGSKLHEKTTLGDLAESQIAVLVWEQWVVRRKGKKATTNVRKRRS